MENYNDKNNSKLNPYFVTGLTNAEGCFSIIKKNNIEQKLRFSLGFKIRMLENEM